ncbi:Dabb family protein [Nocardia sp. NPDC052566]|uniref:Dabb family protein n=1 Tax=Nocardia sp. NPDC052566 TaxID=3364330 RepID=UPI0037C6F9BB
MIVHTVRFGFKDSVTAEQRASGLRILAGMAALESVSYSTLGRSLGGPHPALTHAYCIAFEDLAALCRYLNDPVLHEGDREFLPLLAHLSVDPDITDDADPDLGAKITSAFEQAVTDYPVWAESLQSVPQFDIHNV